MSEITQNTDNENISDFAMLWESKDFAAFEKLWEEKKNILSEVDKQKLLCDIVEWRYQDKYFSFFKKVFDKIIDSKVSLDFHIEHLAPTLLSLCVHISSQKLFDYFLQKGAKLNFIGDHYAFESQEAVGKDKDYYDDDFRYETCLDYAYHKLFDLYHIDFCFSEPAPEMYFPQGMPDFSDIHKSESITLPKRELIYFIMQAQFLHDYMKTDDLKDHIKSLGGKTYEELQEEKQIRLHGKPSDWKPVETMPENLTCDILVKGIYREYFGDKIIDENFVTVLGIDGHNGSRNVYIPGYTPDFDDNFTITHWKEIE